jgi:hypothetical protein
MKTLLAVINLLKTYPAVSGGLVTIAVAVLAHYNFHVTATQIVELVSFTAALSAVVVHNSVTPNVKLVAIEAKETK